MFFISTAIMTVVNFLVLAFGIYLIILAIRALKKYIQTKDIRQEKVSANQSLGNKLREHRNQVKMTQEFVAETIGVSRQAVSKWESGTSDPSTSNLLALAKLYDISADELLKTVSKINLNGK